MKTIAKIALIAALALMPLTAEALPVVTLSDALLSARENNLSLESARVTLNQTMRNQDNLMSTFMPSLSLNGSVGTGMSFSPDTAYSGLTVSAGASASFTFTGSMIKDGDLRNLRKQAADLTYQSAYDTIGYSVISSYWNIAALSSQVDSARLSYEAANEQYLSASAMYEHGLADELAMRQSEQGVNNSRITLAAYSDALVQEKENFKSITGIAGDFTTEPLPSPVFLTLSAEDLYRKYSEGTLAIQSARNALSTAIASKENAELTAYIPSLTANVAYNYSGLADKDWAYSHRTNSLTGGVSVSIPLSGILPGGTADSAIKNAGDAVTLASIALDDAAKQLYKSILSYSLAITQLQQQITLAENGVAIAQRTYDLSSDAFNAGRLTASELSDARRSLLSSQITLLSYRIEHLLSCYALSTTLNIELEELQEACR